MRKGEIEGRQDPFYYIPSLVELEKKVRSISTQRLRDFIISISSGATPSVKEEEKFYSDEENGVPFIRVQNLSPTNELLTDDLRYINQETHQNYLRRSQTFGGDLLVKITGVGRMAVSSVVPEGFEGNTNQHLVVIKTKDFLTSEVLATFLNTDIGEKLASRRATGGTRPALDYSALKSIPIVFKPEIIETVKKAVIAKHAKETEARNLLDGIDAYLLGKLGIETPAETETQKTFFTRASKLSGGRFDSFYHQESFEKLEEALRNGNYEVKKLGDYFSQINYGASVKNEYAETGIPFLRISDLQRNEINITEIMYLPESMRKDLGNAFVYEGDFLISRSGSIGIVAVIPSEINGFAYGSFMIKFRLSDNAPINNEFLSYYLNCEAMQQIVSRNKIGAIQGNITIPTIKGFQIPLPPLEIQEEIAAHIGEIREKAKDLEEQANREVEAAKAEVERMILG